MFNNAIDNTFTLYINGSACLEDSLSSVAQLVKPLLLARIGGAENARLENARTDWLWKTDQAYEQSTHIQTLI